jgi:hypothetical protein
MCLHRNKQSTDRKIPQNALLYMLRREPGSRCLIVLMQPRPSAACSPEPKCPATSPSSSSLANKCSQHRTRRSMVLLTTGTCKNTNHKQRERDQVFARGAPQGGHIHWHYTGTSLTAYASGCALRALIVGDELLGRLEQLAQTT